MYIVENTCVFIINYPFMYSYIWEIPFTYPKNNTLSHNRSFSPKYFPTANNISISQPSVFHSSSATMGLKEYGGCVGMHQPQTSYHIISIRGKEKIMLRCCDKVDGRNRERMNNNSNGKLLLNNSFSKQFLCFLEEIKDWRNRRVLPHLISDYRTFKLRASIRDPSPWTKGTRIWLHVSNGFRISSNFRPPTNPIPYIRHEGSKEDTRKAGTRRTSTISKSKHA